MPSFQENRAATQRSAVRTAVRMLQREVILLVAWGPAILLQFAHPLVARGVADHSAFNTEWWGRAQRLHRTLRAMLQLSLVAKCEALAVAARINTIHDRVHGRLSQAAGIFPQGTAYSCSRSGAARLGARDAA